MKNIIALCLLATLFTACKKDSEDSNTSDAEYYFIGKLDGASVKFEITPSASTEMIISNDASIDPPSCQFTYGCGMGTDFGGSNEKSITVSFPNLYDGDCGNQLVAFPELLPTGNYNYGESTGQVQVNYFDGTEGWTTIGPLESNAVFEITESETVSVGLGTAQKIKGRLSCSLYNADGIEKKLEDATFVLSYWPY
ncbi:MAG: hypothetical protein DYG98_09515 [Haliscomenobacteraceae bacterium CHB4]|nr:hypothetical protein [Saprospiraceae bacterium]MCE7923284.1 hypothetical protein [Haliscomenobacteraceae bacterium CHB4]